MAGSGDGTLFPLWHEGCSDRPRNREMEAEGRQRHDESRVQWVQVSAPSAAPASAFAVILH